MARKQVSQGNLNVTDSAELLSYVINQTPILKENIDLPVQGETINGIGKIIMSNVVYKNAFLNTINIIGITVLTRNHWESPWKEFTDKGSISYGQQIREIIVDLANVYDYNDNLDRESDFIKTEVPNVLSYLHEINYQKYYKTTTSDLQMAMAFEQGDLFSLIDEIVNSLFESYEYDMYLTNKYMLARRILDGTVTPVRITNIDTKTDREIVADIKEISTNMTFRSPNYNPAGLRKATAFEDQFAIVSSKYDAKFTTNVLATSYFRNDAELKSNLALTDGFGTFDMPRLAEIFAKRNDSGEVIANEYVDGYVPFTDSELAVLKAIPCVIVGRDFFQNYNYSIDATSPVKKTDFYNPQTLKTNHWLHTWRCISTSPFENAVVFTTSSIAVTSVTVSPSTATVSKGQDLQMSVAVVTTGFANKAVYWSVDETSYNQGVRITDYGKLKVPANVTVESITVTATSIYDKTKTDDATITVS